MSGKNHHCWVANRTTRALLLRSLSQRLPGVPISMSTSLTLPLRKRHFRRRSNKVHWSLRDHLTMTVAVRKSAESWVQEGVREANDAL